MKTPLLFLFIVLTCYSCCPKEYDELNKDELSWLPYEVGDTLHFKSNLGNIDKWVVAEKKSQELSYGEGHTKCGFKYYHSPQFEILRLSDSLYYNVGIRKQGEIRDYQSVLYIFNTLATSEYYYSNGLFVDTTNVDIRNLYNSNLEYIQFEKNLGIKGFKVENINEVYENF